MTGQIVTEALIALYGGTYSDDAEPESLGYDCINQVLSDSVNAIPTLTPITDTKNT